MARWNFRTQVIDLGIIEMGSDFVVYNGVKVAMPNGEKRFLGKVMMHNEVHSLFNETQGEIVSLYFSGRKDREPALLYGMKTDGEDVYRGETPYRIVKLMILLSLPVLLFWCLVLIGIPAVVAALWYRWHPKRWDPPSRSSFEALTDRGTSSPCTGSGRVIVQEHSGPAT